MEVVNIRAQWTSDWCHVVVFCGAGFVLMAAGMIAVGQTGVLSSWYCSTFVTVAVIGGILLHAARRRLVGSDAPIIDTKTESERQPNTCIWSVGLIMSAVIIVVFTCYVTSNPRGRAVAGFFALLLIVTAFSTNRRAINWKLVIGGIVCQLLLGAILLSWRPVFYVITRAIHIGIAQVQHVLLPGAVSVYVKVVLLAVAWSAVALFFFLNGVVKALLNVTSSVLHRTLGASATTEPLCVFATGTSCSLEAIVSVRRYLALMTRSELHLLLTVSLTASFGHLIPLYIALKFPVEYIVIFNILAAPTAMAVAKLSHPETQHPRSWHDLDLALSHAELSDVLVENGKKNAIDISDDTSNVDKSRGDVILQDVKTIIKFLATVAGFCVGVYVVLALVDVTLVRFHMTDLFSCIFKPLTAAIGIEYRYTDQVARLLGMKLFLPEVTCYGDIRDSLVFDRLDNHSAVVSFFACSGSANVSCMAILSPILVFMRITRQDATLSLVGQAFVNANVVTFLTACIAGIFYNDTPLSIDG